MYDIYVYIFTLLCHEYLQSSPTSWQRATASAVTRVSFEQELIHVAIASYRR